MRLTDERIAILRHENHSPYSFARAVERETKVLLQDGSEARMLEAWKDYNLQATGRVDPNPKFTLEASSHGKAFSFAWRSALGVRDD